MDLWSESYLQAPKYIKAAACESEAKDAYIEKKKEVAYQVPCKDCPKIYIGETKRTWKIRISEHKQAVKKGDENNGIAVP